MSGRISCPALEPEADKVLVYIVQDFGQLECKGCAVTGAGSDGAWPLALAHEQDEGIGLGMSLLGIERKNISSLNLFNPTKRTPPCLA